MKTGVVSQAKGSAYLEMRNTKVVCSVFDPREIPNKSEFSVNGELYCEFKFATFSCKKRRNFIRDPEEKELSVSLKRALEPAVCRVSSCAGCRYSFSLILNHKDTVRSFE